MNVREVSIRLSANQKHAVCVVKFNDKIWFILNERDISHPLIEDESDFLTSLKENFKLEKIGDFYTEYLEFKKVYIENQKGHE